MKRIKTITTALFISTTAIAATHPLNISGKEATSVGIYIAELSSGKILMEHNKSLAFSPASVMKSFTSASALSIIGTDYRFQTDTYAIGEIKNGTLHGNLVIKASGDPTLESKHFPDNRGFIDSIVTNLNRLKISNISGSIIIDQSLIRDQGAVPSWEIEDVAWGYGAGFYALNYRDNNFKLSITSMTTEPEIQNLVVCNNAIIGTDEPILTRGIDSYRLNISGSIPDSKTYTLSCSMPNPANVLSFELKKRLALDGISIHNEKTYVNNDSILIYTHKSPVSQEIMKSLMTRSDNLMAESILRAIAPDSTRASVIKTEIDIWKNRGFDCDLITVRDGSGLSRSNRLSPLFVARVMEWMAKSEMRDNYISMFPLAGKNGTLKNFLKGSRLSGLLALKSGSMNGVQCYAGYKLNNSGNPTHVVVIMANNFFCKRKELIKEIEHLLLKIF
ncbi:MAG: D-alanyl-D-alanine carboxypeptidase/D-alanyl-D-alanine-endopeptidase [Muribaculaceae bacterium]|nr:D-alanyl-D-alanine carboxypeptidase/D-alanyl-D-alanine-endopeptidase [Muribaculaceae bacterium]